MNLPLPHVELTPAARKALEQRTAPLYVEMELYFSCLIRKRVLFHESPPEHLAYAEGDTPNLKVGFSWMMTQSCNLSDVEGDEPPLTAFPGAPDKKLAAWPKRLKLDFKKGTWVGEYSLERRRPAKT